MIYLDNGATSFRKPDAVQRAVIRAMENCANPGRGGYPASMRAAHVVLQCRQRAGELFGCQPEQVVFTWNCTHGLNLAIRSLLKPGMRVVISGFEHNAVTRPLHALGCEITVAGTKLFDRNDTIEAWEQALRKGQDAAIFTCMSNVFGYILPYMEMAKLCRNYGVPFAIDAAQGAGSLPLDLGQLGADFIAMPGHKGLLGPQGTGILLCGALPKPLLYGGTGSLSIQQEMPDFLPDRMEAGTLNVPGIAGLSAGISYILKVKPETILQREHRETERLSNGLRKLGYTVFSGENQGGTISFLGYEDCEKTALYLEKQAIAVRSGLHCAPLAHKSAGTLDTGTVRVSYGHDACPEQTGALLSALEKSIVRDGKRYFL